LFNITPLADLFQTYHKWGFWSIIVVHVTESIFMGRALLKLGLKPNKGLWWVWIADCAVEGLFAWRRMWAEAARVEKEGKGH
jgi:hypothetical protein